MTASPETDAEDFVISYLVSQDILPAAQIAGRMPPVIVPPFILITRVTGDDDYLVDYPTVDVDCFGPTQTAASDLSRTVHHAMRRLTSKVLVTMPDGSIVNPYAPTKTEQTPIFLPWETAGGGAVLDRYVGRYRPRFRLPAVQI